MPDIQAYFDALAPSWDDISPNLQAIRSTAFLSGAGPDTHILDVACGTGIMTKALLDLGARVTGVDLSPAMIREAKRKFPEEAHFFACDILDFSGGPFDAALLFNAWPHFPDKKALCEKIASLLRPGGRFTVAHGMGRAAIDAIHKTVPPEISSPLLAAHEEARALQGLFQVDAILDMPQYYLFSGVRFDTKH